MVILIATSDSKSKFLSIILCERVWRCSGLGIFIACISEEELRKLIKSATLNFTIWNIQSRIK